MFRYTVTEVMQEVNISESGSAATAFKKSDKKKDKVKQDALFLSEYR